MSQWRLSVRESSGRAIVTLFNGEYAVGVFNMSAQQYEQLNALLMSKFARMAHEVLFKAIHDELWQRAQRAAHEDTEQAKKHLLALGWSQDAIDKLARDLVMSLSSEILTMIQEQIT